MQAPRSRHDLIARRQQAQAPHPTSDLRRLQQDFLTLLDEAARAIQQAGLDLDDCIVDRLVALRFVDDPTEIVVDVGSLTEVERLERPFRDAHALRFGASPTDRPVEVVGLEVRAWHDLPAVNETRKRCSPNPAVPCSRAPESG